MTSPLHFLLQNPKTVSLDWKFTEHSFCKKVYQLESLRRTEKTADIHMPRQPRWGSSPYTIPPAINRSCLSSISLPSPFGEGYGGEASYITTMPQSSKSFAALPFLVELVGFEPTSKQGNHTLSTRLFQPLVFVRRQDLDHQPAP